MIQEINYYFEGNVISDSANSYRVNLLTEERWYTQFAKNIFRNDSFSNVDETIKIYHAPSFNLKKEYDGLNHSNFIILHSDKKIILIGGTGYAGEIKKSVFSLLNIILLNQDILPMHCSANYDQQNGTTLYFGLSGTGKTTLSSDSTKELIGDDEHGWTNENTVFNFEGGCYAKAIDLSKEKEPEIYQAIKKGAILENIVMDEQGVIDFSDTSITPNTRVSYPIEHIENIQQPSTGENPQNIFFLTADAFGVLPPISKLTPSQAAYHFISGYTAKVAGTEAGVTEPVPSFSACFGAPFMPLHPTRYAEMLSKKMKEAGVNVWLVNTGWSGGQYGVGKRMALKYTRAMITAVLNGELGNYTYQDYHIHSVFGVAQPRSCPGVPSSVLSPRTTWDDDEAYYKTAFKLSNAFRENFQQFEEFANEEIRRGGPQRYAS